jgi:thiamine-phosphate pyrophosphorylase
MSRLEFRLLLVTDRHLTQRPLTALVQDALNGGVAAVHLREPDLPTRELLALADDLHRMTAVHRVPLIINDRVDVLQALHLDGVHLRSTSLPPSVARRIVGRTPLVGVSTHALEEVLEANEGGADYVVFGPVYETPSKRSFGPPQGVERLGAVCRASRIPVFAIGGITHARVAEVCRAGAYGVAVVGAVLAQRDVAAAARALLHALQAEKSW